MLSESGACGTGIPFADGTVVNPSCNLRHTTFIATKSMTVGTIFAIWSHLGSIGTRVSILALDYLYTRIRTEIPPTTITQLIATTIASLRPAIAAMTHIVIAVKTAQKGLFSYILLAYIAAVSILSLHRLHSVSIRTISWLQVASIHFGDHPRVLSLGAIVAYIEVTGLTSENSGPCADAIPADIAGMGLLQGGMLHRMVFFAVPSLRCCLPAAVKSGYGGGRRKGGNTVRFA